MGGNFNCRLNLLASTDNPSLLWETTKAFVRGITVSYASSKRRKQLEQQRILEGKLEGAEKVCEEPVLRHTEGNHYITLCLRLF